MNWQKNEDDKNEYGCYYIYAAIPEWLTRVHTKSGN